MATEEPTIQTASFAVAPVGGLEYRPDFLTEDEERDLLAHVDAAPWSGELSRRVQHYGYRYDYKTRRISEEMRVGTLPSWLTQIGQRLQTAGVFTVLPDQVIVNEYQSGQGVTPHIDCVPCFGDTVASLSLGSPCVMDFTRSEPEEAHAVLLAPRSLVVLKGASRYEWKHGIAKRKQDTLDGVSHKRGRRVSLTFRTVTLN